MTPQESFFARVETIKGRDVLVFSGAAIALLRGMCIKKYGKSTKRINNKRFKRYLINLLVEGSMETIKEHNK